MNKHAESDSSHEPYHYDPITKKCSVRGASELPQEIFEIADDIEILDASFGQLTQLPDNLGDLKNLRIAFFSNNDFTELPSVLTSCTALEMVGFKSCKIERLDFEALPPTLRGLILTDNKITDMPESIDRLPALQKLMLTGNSITKLPQNILACRSLQLMRLSMNRLGESPDLVFNLPKLAWYSDSRNTYNHNGLQPTEMPTFSWNSIEIGGILGQSAKNTVYAGSIDDRQVAVKLFGAGITTDGNPMDDMSACLAAGDHPHIIGGIGKITDNPDGRVGFVMNRIPDEYETLGNPPDFSTLTRDVFAEDTSYTAEFVKNVVRGIASAMTHLAGRGIMHGDIYTHNIMSRNDGNSYIGDFEAATRFAPGSNAGLQREKVDVRGFGYLLDDLMSHSQDTGGGSLESLRNACLQDDLSQRPTFKEILVSLT